MGQDGGVELASPTSDLMETRQDFQGRAFALPWRCDALTSSFLPHRNHPWTINTPTSPPQETPRPPFEPCFNY